MTATSLFALVLAAQAAPVPERPAPPRAAPLPRRVSPLPPPPAPGPAPRTPPQRARANLSSYFSGDDYPVAALRRKEEGLVGFRLLVGPNGRVADCTITLSSGVLSLDSATCRILRSRARFTPARDDLGNPTAGADSGRVAWRLPEDIFDPLLEAEASATGPPVATPKPPRPRPRASRPRARPRAPVK